MDTLKAILERRSIRSYQRKPVEDSKIEVLLQAANSAPFAGEFQISLITSEDALTELNNQTLDAMKNSGNEFLRSRAALEGYQPMYGAPLMLVFSAARENPYGLASCSNAATCAAIAATDQGLGSCYIVTPTLVLNTDEVMARLSRVPEGFQASCCLIAGYTDDPDKYAAARHRKENVNYVK